MPELLVELLSEEIPARMQARAAEDLKRLVCDGLDEKGLGQYFSEARSFVTPRRLALVIDDLPERQMVSVEVRKGPRSDAPEQAIKGFKGKLPKGATVKERETTKGTFLFASIHKSAQPTPEVLPGIIEAALATLSWPKSMRWGDNIVRWVRPVHRVLCVFDGKVVPVAFGPVESADTTQGHPFMAPKSFKVRNFKDYKAKLLKAHVILDPAERRAVIETEAAKLAKKAGLALKDDPALLDEVTGLVEWPVVLIGKIDEAFMGLPREVLTTAMRHHQKYFALTDKKGELAPRFIVVANTETKDKGKAIVAGNERVLRARLADAKFFWDQDCKRTLESRVGDLGDRVFHAKLGSVLDKAARVEKLAGRLAEACGADAETAQRAARLAKADLSTEMVIEFPELQGVMGRYYALHDGEDKPVADAIAEHYAPKGPGDACPSAPVSVAVALADKLDSLVGFWAIDEKPTGSKDPFALRRAALSVIRLIVENGLRMGLITVIKNAHALLEDPIDKGTVRVQIGPKTVTENGSSFQLKQAHKISSADVLADNLLAFFADRLKVHLREKGVPYDHIDAVFALGDEDDLVRLLARVNALGAFLKTDDGGNLLTAYKRSANIVRIEEKNDGKRYDSEVDTNLLNQNEEKTLHTSLTASFQASSVFMSDDKFDKAMSELAKLRTPVDAFFDCVTVNVDETALRENRLNMLAYIRRALDQVADFSKIEGGER